MKPSSRNHQLALSVWNTQRAHSLSRTEIGLDASHNIHLPSERKGGRIFLDIPSLQKLALRLGCWSLDDLESELGSFPLEVFDL